MTRIVISNLGELLPVEYMVNDRGLETEHVYDMRGVGIRLPDGSLLYRHAYPDEVYTVH